MRRASSSSMTASRTSSRSRPSSSRSDVNLVRAAGPKRHCQPSERSEYAVILLDVQMPQMDGSRCTPHQGARGAAADAGHLPHRARRRSSSRERGLRVRRRGLPLQAAGPGRAAREGSAFVEHVASSGMSPSVVRGGATRPRAAGGARASERRAAAILEASPMPSTRSTATSASLT